MQLAIRLGFVLITSCFFNAQLNAQLFDDPVMKIRMQRAQAQGINEADLPPVPKAIMTPPPLPEPELHIKDSFAYSVVRVATDKKLHHQVATKAIRLKYKAKVKHMRNLQTTNKITTFKRGSRLIGRTIRIDVGKSVADRKFNKKGNNALVKATKVTAAVNQRKVFGKAILKPIKPIKTIKPTKKANVVKKN